MGLRNFNFNEGGMSLVSVMVSAGLMGLIALGTMNLMKNQTKSAKTTEAKFESQSILNSLRIALGDNESCKKTFVDPGPFQPNLAKGTVWQILDKDDRELYRANQDESLAPVIGSSGVKILSFSLDTSAYGPITAGDSGPTDLIVEFARGQDVFGARIIEKKIRLNVMTDAAGDIIDCSSASVDNINQFIEAACGAFGGIYDPVGRPGGTPDCHSLKPNGNTEFNGDVLVNGNVTITDGHYLDLASDKRLKKDFREIDNGLESIRNITPVSFAWKKNGKREIGFIAQNMKEYFPELVTVGKNDLHAVKYQQVSAVNLAGIQQLDRENQELKKELGALRVENTEIKAELLILRNMICELKPDVQACL